MKYFAERWKIPLSKAIRMSDIAEQLHVSTVTVSKALSGKEGVSDELRLRIQQLADQMGYQKKTGKPDTAHESCTIGVVTSQKFIEKGHSFYWTLYERILYHLSQQGHIGILEIIPDEPEYAVQLPRLVQEGRVNGLIIMGSFPDSFRNTLTQSGIPFVILDAFYAKYHQDSVISDGYYGMYTVVQHLIAMGHRRIMFVGTIDATTSITDRYYGYCRAMQEAGIPLSDDLVLPDRNADGKTFLPLDSLHQLPTAFACNCDNTAYVLLNMLKDRGVRVPQDVSITGFDNFILSELTVPRITTYAVDVDKMSKETVRQLIRRIQNPKAAVQRVVVSGSLVMRDSVRRLV